MAPSLNTLNSSTHQDHSFSPLSLGVNHKTLRRPVLRVQTGRGTHFDHLQGPFNTNNTPPEYQDATTPPSAGRFTFNVEDDDLVSSDAEPLSALPSLTSTSSTATSPWSEGLPTPSPRPMSPVLGHANLPLDPVLRSPRRRRSKDHIRRPPNAFIIFRKRFQDNMDLNRDQTKRSRAAGKAWWELTSEEKEAYARMAMEAKEEHARTYPGYVYSPRRRTTKPPKEKTTRTRKAKTTKATRPKVMKTSPSPNGLQTSSTSISSVDAVFFNTFAVEPPARTPGKSALFASPLPQTEVSSSKCMSVFTSDVSHLPGI